MALSKWCIAFLLICAASAATENSARDNEVIRGIRSGEDLVSAVTQDCLEKHDSLMTCLRQKVLSYVNHILGVRDHFEGRHMSDDKMDAIIATRLKKYINTHEFKIQLPQFLFEDTTLTFNPSRGLADFKVDFPEEPLKEDRSIAEARGHLKKKLLLPFLLLLKLKIKALTPILLVLIGIKAVKAFIMSKISLLLVIGFILLQLFKKGGMMMPMAMMPAPVATDPPPVYGPPQTSPTYGPPAATPETSYGPWDSTSNSNGNGNGNGNGNPYSRWDSHSIVYNAHQPETVGKTMQQQQQQGI
ncbi:hypothetical protein RUM43_013054 [Polyplax serrata]|uniref:Osiris 20 n=1 Tax=Polyplax serrata TaxID=468196 RepID=A0AAN8RZ47_POLSC